MKKLNKVLILLLIVVTSLFFFACDKKEHNSNEPKNVTLYIIDADNHELAEYQREISGETVADLFLHLAKEEDSTFSYSSTTVATDQFINSITTYTDTETWQTTGLFPEPNKGEFCAFYHTLNDIKYTDPTIEPLTYNKIKFNSSGTGISATPLVDNASYLYTIKVYSYE